MNNPKEDQKEKKDPFQERKKEKNRERERSFLNRNAFLSFPVHADSDQCTPLAHSTIDAKRYKNVH